MGTTIVYSTKPKYKRIYKQIFNFLPSWLDWIYFETHLIEETRK